MITEGGMGDHIVTVLRTLFQFPCLQSASCSNSPPLLSHRCQLGQTEWCQLPISPALWLMRAPSSGNGPSHLGSSSTRCGSLMGLGPALCRYHGSSAANAGDYTCQASFNGQSAENTVLIQLNGN